MTLITKSRQELQKITTALQREALKMGLTVNESKTKFMVWGEKVPGIGQHLNTYLESEEPVHV